MLKKVKITTFLVSIPISFMSLFALAGTESNSLENLKEECIRLRSNQQVKPFSIKIQCSGKYSFWERAENKTCMQNKSFISSQTSTKGGMYQTSESLFEKELDKSQINCPVYSKMEVSSPNGVGIIVTIDSCEDLDAQNLETTCEQKVLSYCQNNQDTCAQQDVQQMGGMCSINEVQRIDTCASYN